MMRASDLIAWLQNRVAEHGDIPVIIPAEDRYSGLTAHGIAGACAEIADGLPAISLWATAPLPEHAARSAYNQARGASLHDPDAFHAGSTGIYTQLPDADWVQAAIDSGDRDRMNATLNALAPGFTRFRILCALGELDEADQARSNS